MKVTNETDYDTRYLRKLFLACERHEGTNPKYRHVKIIYSRGNGIGGYAWYNSNSVAIKLPHNYRNAPMRLNYIPKWAGKEYREKIEKLREKYPVEPLPTRRIAQVYIHEVGHNLGLHHKDMPLSVNIDVSWLPDESVPLKAAKPKKPKPNIVEVRAAKAQKKLDEWMKKWKRAKVFVKKYQSKIRYYERKRAASK